MTPDDAIIALQREAAALRSRGKVNRADRLEAVAALIVAMAATHPRFMLTGALHAGLDKMIDAVSAKIKERRDA